MFKSIGVLTRVRRLKAFTPPVEEWGLRVCKNGNSIRSCCLQDPVHGEYRIMSKLTNTDLNYSRPIEIAEGVFWVGFYDVHPGSHCNPYFITDGKEAIVIDGGSRPDFPSVMMKILSTGVAPSSIVALIYQHYDPDLCGSISNFEDIIDREDLKIISAKSNHMFIRHYAANSDLFSLEDYTEGFGFLPGANSSSFLPPTLIRKAASSRSIARREPYSPATCSAVTVSNGICT